jgi:hypothetical protein
MPKSYRIRTEVGQDKYINVQLEQDFDQLEILSLKINESDIYTRVCSDYGVVVGRVLVNGGFGIPNAKVSVFIPLTQEDETNPIISELYPYKSLSDLNEDGYRYNLLPKDPSYSTHAATGTFPTREEVLLDQSYIEVYDKYYKFSVKTNDSGDFMIFGVPTGNQTLVMDVDLSDIGCFSLAPQDLVDLGIASQSQVNGNTFKTSSNLNELPQIKTLNKVVEISPFWGDVDICQFGITRVDFDLTAEANIKIEPKAIFMGSIITTAEDDALKTNCKPKNNTGNLCELITGPGQILAIRQTIFPDSDNLPILETYEFDNNGKVIDGDGSFLVNVPMNIDYVITNEFGQQVLSNDPKKGIPTKGRYRFKFKWENEQGLQNQFQRANFLVPNIKEHGWTSSGNDPFDPTTAQSVVVTLPVGVVTGSTTPVVGTGGYLLEDRINSSNLTIIINGQPYFGDPTSIPVTAGDTIQFISNPVDDTQPQTFNITFLPQSYFEVLKSYSFSLDWDDYNDVQQAINCEDTFYEFNYNKVYTTAMFLDRYKNGIGRARHLGIKEIDNRTCKTTVNTFPVNDIIRNFDFLFFVFNMLINILTFPILVLLFIAHFICFLWPILKYALIFLGLYFLYVQVEAGIDYVNSILELTATSVPGGPVINAGVIARTIWQGLQILVKAALAVVFTIFVINKLTKIKNFPRIGLPMISYPECNTCDCDCGNAPQDDDFDSNTITQDIQNQQNSLSGGNQPPTAQSNSFLAPLNLPQTYSVNHPNYEQISGYDANDDNGGYFGYCLNIFGNVIEYRSLINRLVAQDITAEVATQALIDFKRLFSGYDVTSGAEFNRFKAPQPFLFAANRLSLSPDERFFARPRTVTYPQRLNEFNTRDKYFSGVNKIKTNVNNSPDIYDQIIVMIVQIGTTATLGDKLFTFQNPKQSNCQINLTGATLNQFGNNAITGTSLTNPISISSTIQYATTDATNQTVPISIIQTGSTENYLKYATDVEYYQVITGMTVGTFETLADFATNPNDFPASYLRHKIRYDIMTPTACPTPTQIVSPITRFGTQVNDFTAIQQISQYENYEIIFVVRGVDPHTEKQNIKYDLSRIFGKSFGAGPIISGQYHLNVPIQGYAGGTKPKSHKTTTNVSTNLYFPSYTFTPDPTQYTPFTSNLPYYFISTDDTTIPSNLTYKPVTTHPDTQTIAGALLTQVLGTNGYKLPKYDTQNLQIGGGTFIGLNTNTYPVTPTSLATPFIPQYFQTTVTGSNQDQKEEYGWIGNSTSTVYALYSSAYYNFSLPDVNFNDSVNIVMRSDRLPTSTKTESGPATATGYGLHQNNNFTYYTVDALSDGGSTTSIGGNIPSGEGSDSENQGLLQTLTCENLVPLDCYQGSGNNVTVNPNCAIPADRLVRGCYCLLNKTYLFQYDEDVKLFLEWKTRFTITFAACRGIFAQAFQNNWINGTLYMFTFNKRNSYTLTNPTDPTYVYCDDVVLFNDINNGFYYRSSPWDGTNFIGKNSPAPPANIPTSLITGYPGLGYNGKQIQFPTTVVDLGPREKFISEICNNNNFTSYFVDQVKSTSYQDNSDIIQVGFLSRLLNDNFRQAIIPIANPNGGNTEGKGIIQFFNSTRQADRIDGDFAQMLSVNSEWRILPFLSENYQNPNSIYFGDDTQSGDGYPRPVFGVFFETETIDYSYRRNLTPGFETLNYTPLLQYYYGFPKTQDVPFYRWKIESQGPSIFGNENNNWDTTYAPGQPGSGFTTRGYQDLDFTLPNEYYKTPTTELGYLVNFDALGNPQPILSNANSYVVGAPFHFYFGLNNGKTAIDKFVKLYISTEG